MLNFKHVSHSVSCLTTLMNTNSLKRLNALSNMCILEPTLPAQQTPLHPRVDVNQYFQEVL